MNSHNFQDLTGQKIGELVVLRFLGCENDTSRWECKCSCGTIRAFRAGCLKKGTQSCGCKTADLIGNGHRVHGEAATTRTKQTKEHRAWASAKARCYRKTIPNYNDYGGRGITMCERWRLSFENFLSDMGRAPAGFSLGRIDNNGNYEPSNCRWEDAVTQANNSRQNVFAELNGERKTIAQWARLRGISYATLRYRVKKGWKTKSALTVPASLGNNQTLCRT